MYYVMYNQLEVLSIVGCVPSISALQSSQGSRCNNIGFRNHYTIRHETSSEQGQDATRASLGQRFLNPLVPTIGVGMYSTGRTSGLGPIKAPPERKILEAVDLSTQPQGLVQEEEGVYLRALPPHCS
jgi:hypothetical protein